MNRIVRVALLVVLLLVNGFQGLLFAQISDCNEDGLVKEWLQKDQECLHFLLTLVPFTANTVEKLESRIKDYTGGKTYRSPHYGFEEGFGVEHVGYTIPGGYTRLVFQVHLVDGTIDDCQLEISGSNETWSVVKKRILTHEIEKKLPGLAFSDSGCSIILRQGSWEDTLRQRTDAYFGSYLPVLAPKELAKEYAYLRDPNVSLALGNFCYPVGYPPHGRIEIEYFLDPTCFEMLAGIARGYNGVGRAYAVLAMLELERRGHALPDACRQAIDKNLALNFEVDMCLGCEFFRCSLAEVIERKVVDFSLDMSDRMEEK